MSYDKITVVINTFHSEDKIDKCLNSINPKIKILVIENSNNSNFKLNLEKKYSNVTCYLTGENLGYAKGDFPMSEKISSKIFSIPMHPYLSRVQQDKIIEILNNE